MRAPAGNTDDGFSARGVESVVDNDTAVVEAVVDNNRLRDSAGTAANQLEWAEVVADAHRHVARGREVELLAVAEPHQGRLRELVGVDGERLAVMDHLLRAVAKVHADLL